MARTPPCRGDSPGRTRCLPGRFAGVSGFTLIEIILVLVLIVIVSGIALPYFASSFRGSQLRTSARTVERLSRYARSMAILREEPLTMVLDPNTMEIYLGGATQTTTNRADGELDQEVLKRLGYVEGAPEGGGSTPVDKEIHRYLPEGLGIYQFEKDQNWDDEEYPDLHLVRFYPNGRCEWFRMELEDDHGMGMVVEIDPVTGKVRSKTRQ